MGEIIHQNSKEISFLQLLKSFFKTFGLLFLLIASGLILDSTFFIQYNLNGQFYANILIIIISAIIFYFATNRYKELMIYAVIIGFLGEYIFSVGLGMYTYRLENVPLYIPFGHAIVYIAAAYFCKERQVKLHKHQLEKFFLMLILIYAFGFLIFLKDIFGFSLTILIIFLLRNKPRERLFYYAMYLIVAFLEIIGTSYKCWVWPDTAFGTISFLKSANPPCGISFFYFGLDLGCLWLYKQRHKIAWKRMKNIRKLRQQ